MKICLTGSTGFLGKIIFKNLSKDNVVRTIGRADAEIIVDLSKEVLNLDYFDLVIHCAGLAHVTKKSKVKEISFFDVNVQGSINLLLSLESNPPKFFVFISSVSVYGLETGININESQIPFPKDPYGLSKLQAENLILDWCKINKVVCTILRLPLVIGNNSKGNLERLIKAIKLGIYFNIGGGNSRRSMVLADDVANFIIKSSFVGGVYNLTDGIHPTFKEFSGLISKQLNKSKPFNIPFFIAFIFSKIGDILPFYFPLDSKVFLKMTSDLTFDDTQARINFMWKSNSVLDTFKLE
uniref:NAD-dependent epimerase/dehydratase family protein n=1 Tax=Algoriphagus sp. TaxID=1872435 RepID=UPI00404849EB